MVVHKVIEEMNIILTCLTIYALGAIFVEILIESILTFSSNKFAILREIVNVSDEYNVLAHDILNFTKLMLIMGSWYTLYKYIKKKCFI